MKFFDASATELLRQTSRTFFVPIIRLPSDLRCAVGSAYLCMRGIDEIEDHHDLPMPDIIDLLERVSTVLHGATDERHLAALSDIFAPFGDRLPEVTRAIGRHAMLAPEGVARAVWKSTAEMAHRMAHWARVEWKVTTEEDLHDYTFDVAGRVGVLLTDLWRWYDGTSASHELSSGYGRGLQAVNIIRNRDEDAERGVSFYPDGWTPSDMHEYARQQLAMGDEYLRALQGGPALNFCRVPLELAYATLDTILAGKEKLSRGKVLELIERCTGVKQVDEVRVGD